MVNRLAPGLLAMSLLCALAPSARGDWHVWTLTQTVRVPRDAPAGAGRTVHLAAARNETESFQILARSDAAVKGIRVEAGDLKGPGGTVLRASDGRLIEAIANVRDITRQKEAEEVKTTFVSIVSHELKTPVAIIKGYASTLRREDADWDPPTLQKGLRVIEEESDRLDRLITNLLEASRIQAAGLNLNLGPLEIVGLVRKLVDEFRPQTDKHTFEVDFPPGFPPLWVDYERIRMVLSNLLSNAIKYSPKGGQIRVGGWTEIERAVIYVADEGIGIPEAEIPHIFERFYRVDNRLSRTTAGTGLGLYLSQAIVEAHGGEIWVRSQPGQGSTFFFSLPRREGGV